MEYERGSRSTRIVLDSRARDKLAFPTPSKYEVRLDNDLFNVTSLELVTSSIPFPAYLISPSRCSLNIEDGGTTYSLAVPIGNYAPEDLATGITYALSALGMLVECSYAKLTDRFEFRSPSTFKLLTNGMPPESLASILGFGVTQDYTAEYDTSATQFVCQGPYRKNFNVDRYVVMRLYPCAEIISSPSQAIDRAFAVIPNPITRKNRNYEANDDQIIKRWNPPLPRLARIMIELTDCSGAPYDFQNQDHYIEIRVELCVNRTAT